MKAIAMALEGTRTALDPRHFAPVGSYLTDGHRLLYVLESDERGCVCEDASSDLLVEVSRSELERPPWRRVDPAGSA